MNCKKIRKQIYTWSLTVLLAGSLSACGGGTSATEIATGNNATENNVTENNATVNKLDQKDIFSDRDKEIGYDESQCVAVSLADSGSSGNGKGVSIEGDVVTITDEGTYLLSGTLSNGQIVVDADNKKIRLVFDGVSVNCDTSAALYVRQADKVFVTLTDGTSNQLSNKQEFAAIDDNSIDGVVFSKDDLVFNGNGALEVTASYGHGIVSKDDLRITGGTYKVTAAEHALAGKDSVAILDGVFTLTAGKDGIHSENTDDSTRGYVFVQDGTFTIRADGDGMDASNILQIEDGEFDIAAGGGSANAGVSSKQDNFQHGQKEDFLHGDRADFQAGEGFPKGEFDRGRGENRDDIDGQEMPQGEMPQGEVPGNIPEPPSGEMPQGEATENTVSTKGLKADLDIFLDGGRIKIDAADDAVHANGSMQVDGGTFTLSSGDDGMHADEGLLVDDGEINISESYEGLEGMTITVNGGTINIVSKDDGLNAAGGADQSGFGGGKDRDSFEASEDCRIEINGGYLTIDASGDGIDSNGMLTINGGEIYVSGPENSGNGALDFGSKAVINGGTLIAAGASGMTENFDSSSAQCSMLVQLDAACTGGQITLTDASGEELASFTADKSYNSVYISCAKLQQGETYTLTTQDTTTTVKLTETNFSNVQGGGFR